MTNQEILDKIHGLNFQMFQELDRLCRKYDIKYMFACGSLLGVIRHKGFIPWDNDIDIWMSREDFEKLYQHREELNDAYEIIMPEIFGNKKYLDCIPRLSYKYMHIKMDESLCQYYNNLNNRLDIDIFFLDKTRDDLLGKFQRVEMIFLYCLMNSYRHNVINRAAYPWYLKVPAALLKISGRCFSLDWLRVRVSKVARRFQKDPEAKYLFSSNDGIAWRLLIPIEECRSIRYGEFEGVQAPIPEDADAILKIWYGDYMKLPPKEKQIPHYGRIMVEASQFVFETPESATN